MEKKSRFEGCLIGGAVGDALGWPIEFLKLDEIKKRFGDKGIIELTQSDCGKAEITDNWKYAWCITWHSKSPARMA